MSSKFINTKRIVLPFLTILLIVGMLPGCHYTTEDIPDDTSPEIVIEMNTPMPEVTPEVTIDELYTKDKMQAIFEEVYNQAKESEIRTTVALEASVILTKHPDFAKFPGSCQREFTEFIAAKEAEEAAAEDPLITNDEITPPAEPPAPVQKPVQQQPSSQPDYKDNGEAVYAEGFVPKYEGTLGTAKPTGADFEITLYQ